MAEVKQGWRRLRFDEMVTSAGATRKARGWTAATAGVEHYVGLEHLDANSSTIQRWGSPDDVGENSDLRPFEAGDVILARRGIEQRKVGFAAFAGVASGHALVFRARPGVVLPEFLPYFLLSDAFMGRVDQFSAGSLSKTVNLSTLLRLEFALPPLDEQRRVATLLRAAGETAEACNNLVGAANATRGALREALIERYSHPVRAVGTLCEMQNGRPFLSSEYSKTGIRLLRPANLAQDGTLDWRDERTVCMPNDYRVDADKFLVSRGDVVINLTAQSLDDGFMGRVCLAGTGEASLLNQRIGRFVRFRGDLLPEYLFRVLQGARFQAHAKAMCEGTKVKHMFWRHIDVFKLPLPPINAQTDACEKMRAADDACREAARRAQGAKRLASRLVNDALVGEA